MNLVLRKMPHRGTSPVRYTLGDVDLNEAVGRELHIDYSGRKLCVACQRKIKKTFGDGYCYPCFTSLARTDSCIIRPHTCHYHKGTCREPVWGEEHCLVPHVVYLALTSGLKVGVTGAHKVEERWGDQGAAAALVLARTPDRKTAGRIETALAGQIPDRSNWRRLITADPEPLDLAREKHRVAGLIPGELSGHLADEARIETFSYPVSQYPPKARTLSLDKQPSIGGVLTGIKGQYLLFASAGFNVRRHSGYQVTIRIS
jgi:hypothetical protein